MQKLELWQRLKNFPNLFSDGWNCKSKFKIQTRALFFSPHIWFNLFLFKHHASLSLSVFFHLQSSLFDSFTEPAMMVLVGKCCLNTTLMRSLPPCSLLTMKWYVTNQTLLIKVRNSEEVTLLCGTLEYPFPPYNMYCYNIQQWCIWDYYPFSKWIWKFPITTKGLHIVHVLYF